MKHATHRMHEHSLKAYTTSQTMLAGRQAEVYEWLISNGPATDREVMQGLGYRDMNAVRPRLSELIEKGMIGEVGERACEVTGKTVRILDVRKSKPIL